MSNFKELSVNKFFLFKKQPKKIKLLTQYYSLILNLVKHKIIKAMKILLNRVDDAFHFEAKNEDGNIVHIDGAPAIGGTGSGARPMQLLIMGLGGCSAMDMILILKKQKQVIDDLQIELDAERFEDRTPAPFKDIHVTFKFKGDLDVKKIKRAVALSMDKYCSVTKILEETATITYSSTVNGEPVV